MDVEYDTRVIPILPGKYEEGCKAMQDEGWQVIPGQHPVAIFPVYRTRMPVPDGAVARGELKVDETKVGILRADGTTEWGDGRVTDRDGNLMNGQSS